MTLRSMQVPSGAAVAIALIGLGAAAAPVQIPPCQDPVIVASFKLEQAKQYDRAQTVVAPLLAKRQTASCAADMAIAIERARKWAENEPYPKLIKDFRKRVLSIMCWAALAVAGIAASCFFVGVVRFVSFVRRSNFKPVWRVRSIAPGSDPAVIGAWNTAMERSASRKYTSSNLLIQSGLPLPKAIVTGGETPDGMQHLFEGAPAVQGVSLSWLSKLVSFVLRQCQSPRRTLSITATSHEKSVIVWLEACDARAKVRTVLAAATCASDADFAEEIDRMAAALALKTNYLIAEGATDASVDQQMRLHKGIDELNAYSKQSDTAALRRAAEAFAEARQAGPDATVATLYEGIANELLEEHDRASRLFIELGATSPITEQTTSVVLQAAYNLAITELRRYRPASVVAAENRLKILADAIGALPTSSQTDDKQRLRAFAWAACANAAAHKFIFWERIGIAGPKDLILWPGADAAQKAAELNSWKDTAELLIQQAEAQLAESYFANEAVTATQLRWLIGNAKGNLALNRAMCAGPTNIADDTARATVLEQALEAFQICEALFSPGVETLTNIATTLLELDRPTAALDYARRARALNPRYEYAYMREYQALMRRNDRFAMMSFLTDADRELGAIKIPEFQKMFEDAGVRYHDR